ncbi:MAG: hypothetical protein RMM53_00810, partial [Bacteroidia bacterium]|nr:hypothetical protein [Bacteroidia bacterium]MDW8332736.1 hypothetical protein [Bacteroidia bacterium]
MIFDLDMIRRFYAGLGEKVEAARKLVGRPLTFTEKALYAHLYAPAQAPFERGKSYVDFAVDRVAM